MDPSLLIPTPDSLPVHWAVLMILLVATTFLHLVAMNVMFGGGVLAYAAHCKFGDGSPVSKEVSQTLIYATALTVNMGVAPLLFLQALYGQFFYTSTVLMAVYWLLVVFLLLLSYASLYKYRLCFAGHGGGMIYLAFPVLFMCLMSFFFCNNISLMQMPSSWFGFFENRGGWLINFADISLIPRYLHFVLSAVALGGLTIAFLFDKKKRAGDSKAASWIEYGCGWFTKATIANFGAGFLFLGTLPKTVVGSQAPHSGLFILFVIASVAAIIPALQAAHTMDISRAIRWTLLTIFLMTVAREVSRVNALSPYLQFSALPMAPQYTPFLVFLAAAVGVAVLLVRMFLQVRSEMEVQ